jgi:RimJ/RimL family protein N-acetyltransferase
VNVECDGNLILRPVTMADARLLHDWRNDPETRRNSRSGNVVPWSDHQAWLAAVIGSSDWVIRIAQWDGEPVGVVRAERLSHGWELSWTVAPHARGHGIGGRMLRIFVVGLDGRLAAIIRRDNVASAEIAAAIGLIRIGADERHEFERWVRN